MGCSGSESSFEHKKYGGIVCGGTMIEVAIGNEKGKILERKSFETSAPKSTIEQVIEFFKLHPVDSLGIASFGPIDPDKKSETYGYITTTPKPGWANFNIVGEIKNAFRKMKIGFDTDVNAACLGEVIFGSAKGIENVLYLYIGQGIGGGAFVEGHLMHGLLHPEMGHIKLIKRNSDTYVGHCPYHRACLEGLADEPSLEARTNLKYKEIASDDPIWDLEAFYIGQACSGYILTLSPQKIILGGPVMKQTQLFPMIYEYTKEMLNNYIQKKEILQNIENYIISPSLGNDAMLIGAFALAINAEKEN